MLDVNKDNINEKFEETKLRRTSGKDWGENWSVLKMDWRKTEIVQWEKERNTMRRKIFLTSVLLHDSCWPKSKRTKNNIGIV